MVTERCKDFKEGFETFEQSKGGNIPIGTILVSSEYFAQPLTREEIAFCETLGYKYLGQGRYSGAFGITDHQFEYVGKAT